MRDDRARITVPDVLLLLFAFAFMAALAPVFLDAVHSHVSDLSPGTAYLVEMFIPFMILVFLGVVFGTAARGV